MQDPWTVVAVLKETPKQVKRFVSWHLANGAHKMILFFDDPQDPCIGMLNHLDQVEAVPCTPEFWEALGLHQSDRF